MFSLIYNALLTGFAVAMIPKMIYMRVMHGKYKICLWQRLGLGFPKNFYSEKKTVWIHAVSVGETKAVAKLISGIKAQYPDAFYIISNGTETGHEEAKKLMPFLDYFFFMPFDFSWISQPIVRRFKPDLVLISETDLWYHFLQEAKEGGASIALINGKISERSHKRSLSLPFFTKRLYALIDRFCLQSNEYAERFASLGVPKEKIRVTGNLKLDHQAVAMQEDQKYILKQKLGLGAYHEVLVIGSTHSPEEKHLLKALEPLWKEFSNLKVLLVPRHPERFDKVAKLLKELNISFQRYTQESNDPHTKVTLVDTMGMLQQCYQMGDLAIVGGSFFKDVGGHNILEPIRVGVPVLFGPYMHGQKELEHLVIEAEAGVQLPLEQLTKVVKSLLKDSNERKRMGEAGKHMLTDLLGAVERTEVALEPLFFTSGLISFAKKSQDMVDFSSQV